MHVKLWVQIGGLALLAALTIVFVACQVPGHRFQSPLPTGPAMPGVAVSPLPWAPAQRTGVFDAPIWASLWLGMALGLVLFGGLALGLITLVRREKDPKP